MRIAKTTLVALTLATTVMTTSSVLANNSNNFTKGTITCTTTLVCKKLTEFIQAKIDELEAKGNLTNDDKRLRYNLKKQLIAVENKTYEIQQVTIATENQKQEQQREAIESKLQAQDQKLADLRGELLEN